MNKGNSKSAKAGRLPEPGQKVGLPDRPPQAWFLASGLTCSGRVFYHFCFTTLKWTLACGGGLHILVKVFQTLLGKKWAINKMPSEQ